MTETYIIYTLLTVLGAMFGSFAAATVWRLRARQLDQDKRRGEKVTKAERQEVARLQKRSIATERSVCLHCGTQLMWYELIPIISWVALRGRCRSCKQPIGYMEFFAEIGLAAGFALSYTLWPHALITAAEQGMFIIWLAILVLLAIHWMYDARWQLLLDKITVFILLLSAVYAALYMHAFSVSLADYAMQAGILLLILPAFYGLLWVISKGSWIGLGDVKLLVPFAIMLSSWEYGLLVIFLANLIGLIAVLPGMMLGRVTRSSRVPFGPFLIVAFIVTMLVGHTFIRYYVQNFIY